ncbi:MAG: hypothetical protein EBT30_10025, partial [Verrucomicrobia bacterium]|nr:hypothetical protein [Verrucomicrobiota bacterium]
LTLGGMVNNGQGTIRGTLTVNEGATVNYTNVPGTLYGGAHAFGWAAGQAVSVLNINGGTVGGADLANHFSENSSFTLNMTGGELKLGGAENPTAVMSINVLASSNQAVISKVNANAALTIDNRATFTVGNGSQDVDLLVSANLNQRSPKVGEVTKQGAGVMTVSGSNTYTGATIVGGGTLRAGSSNAFGVNSATTLSNGVVLDLNGSVTLGSANLTLGGGGQTGTFGGSISGTGGLYKTFAGRQTLTGSNTYSGVTRVDGGILTLAGTNGSAIYSDGRNGKLIIGGNGNGYYGIFNMVEIGAARQLGANVDLEFDVNVPYSYLALMGNNLEIGNLTMNGSRSDWAVIENSEGVYGLSTG